MYTIKQCNTKNLKNLFIDFPYQLNKNNPHWIPPLKLSILDTFNFEKNPFWKLVDYDFWIVTKQEIVVGRVLALINHPQNKIENNKIGHFGFLESIDNQDVFKLLLDTATNWCSSKGMNKIMGPLNPSLNYELGVLTKGFDLDPYFMMTYNATYYNQNIITCGFCPSMEFYAYQLDVANFHASNKILAICNRYFKNKSIIIRNINLKNFDKESETIRNIYNDAFQSHWGYVPFEKDEFKFMAKDMTQIINPNLLFTIMVDNEDVAFILALPNLNEVLKKIKNGKLFPFGFIKLLYLKKYIKSVRVINIAIKSKYEHLGLGALLYIEMVKRLKQNGYMTGEMSWVAANNLKMNNAITTMGGKVTKKYLIYEKNI